MLWLWLATVLFVISCQFLCVLPCNVTISKQCMVIVEEQVEKCKTVKMTPDCGFFKKIWNVFNNKCKTKYRTECYFENENKTEPGHCSSTICCEEYVMSGGECILGCPNGTYGENCTQNCTCPDYTHCDKDNGNCTCQAGFMGENCTEYCHEGFYGDDCQQRCYCSNNATCDKQDGHCNCTEPGWTGDFCDEQCNLTFGIGCSENCTCNENQTCDPVNGNCTCKPGFSGDDCSHECEVWNFGVDCLYNCSCDTNNTEKCDRVGGQCTCRSGFIGENCTDICPWGYYGDNCASHCSCVGTTLCDHVNGTCICFGNHGENCSEECEQNHYSFDCNTTCGCTGENHNGSCDPYNGTCFCSPGWHGSNCSDNGTQGTDNKSVTEEYIKPGEESMMTYQLMVALIVGGCAVVVIAIIIVVVLIQRRKQECFDRQNVTQYKNAAYGEYIPEDEIVLSGVRNQSQGEEKCDEATPKNKDGLKCQHEATNNEKVSEIEDSNSDVDSKGDDHYSDVDSQRDNHYSDVDSQKDDNIPRSYSLIKVDDNTLSGESISNQHKLDEEQYDSLESSLDGGKKKLVSLPNYSSFEEIFKEKLDESEQDFDEPYDKLVLNRKQKQTLTRNDYNTVTISNRTPKDELDRDTNFSHIKLCSNMNVCQNITSDTKDNDIENNSQSWTGKPFETTKAPVSAEERSINLNEKYNAALNDEGSIMSNFETEEAGLNQIVTELINIPLEESEYSKLDHTGKTFRAINPPENIYHTNRFLEKSGDNPEAKTLVKGDSKMKDELNPDPNDNDVTNVSDAEYNCLDHTGKLNQEVEIPDSMYHGEALKQQQRTESSQINIPVNNEEDFYSFCEIDDDETNHDEKGDTADEKSLYEIPDITESEVAKDVSDKEDGKHISKPKAKTKQRQNDDYEPFVLANH